MTGGVKRRYDSTRRQQQALENRRRIVRAACELFAERGYGRTTLADIAASAGVAVETVYAAFKNKPALLHRAWDVTVVGDDCDIQLLDRPELREVFDEPDLPTRLRKLAVVNTGLMRRTTALRRAVEDAAATDQAAADMLAEIDRQRLESMAAHAEAAQATGRLGVSEVECRDVLWTTTDGSLWHGLVRLRGWTDERYARWLGDLWVAQLT
ncbi:TetR family transcriptional regulator [Amycolatopsis xylanica]|uniref:TetR family transcriptional regulator n=1 Tax=Amycolatopsis xylanica TaxID=589385 RepID=UPI001FE03E84|nr:TetR family transcriptional regulator [Amycolatopsis xylanica]